MPHAKVATGTNFESIVIGLTPNGNIWDFGDYRMYFIVPENYNPTIFGDREDKFRNSRFCCFRKSCEKHLIDYHNHKII